VQIVEAVAARTVGGKCPIGGHRDTNDYDPHILGLSKGCTWCSILRT
jgi:hypothetical protein